MVEDFKPKNDVTLPTVLDEFRQALKDEIQQVEKNGQSSIILKEGRLIDNKGDAFWYVFNVEYMPQTPADTPCKIIIGKKTYPATVVKFEENEIILECKEKLPNTIAQAELENGSTVLMEQLIKRIETNASKENPAGSRMLPQALGLNPIPFSCIEPNVNVVYGSGNEPNEGQKEAIKSSLENDITYIWGPPGTGKTTVISTIIENLYKASRRVLVVSHTNTAVDGAIEKVFKALKDDTSLPVLRIGTMQKALDEKVTLEYHTRVLGEALFERKDKLEEENKQCYFRLGFIEKAIAEIEWLHNTKIIELLKESDAVSELTDTVNEINEEYSSALSDYNLYKQTHSEAERYSELEGKLEPTKKSYNFTYNEIEDKYKTLEALKEDIALCDEELRKHSVHDSLLQELGKHMSEGFLIDEIGKKDMEYDKIYNRHNGLVSKSNALQKTIDEYNKGGMTRFLYRMKFLAAQKEKPTVDAELKKVEDEILVCENVRKKYKEELIEVRSLHQQIKAVQPSLSAEHWQEQKLSKISRYTQTEETVEQLKSKLDNLKGLIDSYQTEMDSLAAANSKLKELYARTILLEQEYRVANTRLNDKKQKVVDKINIEILAMAPFRHISFTDVDETLTVIDEEYERVKDDVKGLLPDKLLQESEEINERIAAIKAELSSIASQIEDLEKTAIESAQVVGATLAKSYLSDILQESEFDTVILDEASMASIPALWCASYIAKRNIIIVGDFLQLPPIVVSETEMSKKWLGRDIFAVSGMQELALRKNQANKPANFVMLDHQFRMEKAIADIANMYYGKYKKLVSDDASRFDSRQKFYEQYPVKRTEKPIEIIDTSNIHAWVTTVPQGKKHSRLNCFSAVLSVQLACELLKKQIEDIKNTNIASPEPKVLIVAPYKPHVARINDLIECEYKQLGIRLDANLIKAGTIHSFQGSEADIVIFDLVLDEPHWRANLFMTDKELNDDLRKMFNVAVTRAKFKLYVLGNIQYCRSKAKDNALSELLDYLVDKKKYTVVDAKKAFKNVTYAKPTVFGVEEQLFYKHIICKEDAFFKYLVADIRNFEKRLVIFSPFMTKARVSKLLPWFADAITQGKRIIVITKSPEDRKKTELSSYVEIEEILRKHGIQIIYKKGMHEKLIFIDDKAVWTGSLNALSFAGNTGEVMHRHNDEVITAGYQKIHDIPSIDDSVLDAEELRCPICGGSMQLNEGDRGYYWKCINSDYSRRMDQAYPHDGVLRCHCGGEYLFSMKKEPRWICSVNSKHFAKMHKGDLDLEKMAAKIPTKKERKEVDKYFAQFAKKDTPKGKTASKPSTKDKTSKAGSKKDDVEEISLFS